MTSDYLSGQALYDDVIRYASFGDHRTGTAGERAATRWLARRLQSAGLTVSYQPVPVRQFFVRESSLTVAGSPVECFPLWYPRAGSVTAPLTRQAEDRAARGKVVLLGPTPRADTAAALARLKAAGALGAVIIAGGQSGLVAAANVPDDAPPSPFPAVLVGSADRDRLLPATGDGQQVTLTVRGTNRTADAQNLFGRWQAGKDVIVVSTPKSGWFRCGGERGPGIAILLAVARWVCERKPAISYLLDFNTGHELHNLGTRRFLSGLAPPAASTRAWVHLGASIATWSYEATAAGLRHFADPARYIIEANSPRALDVAARAFAHLPAVKPRQGPGIGEFGPVTAAGYEGLGVYGGPYRFFHTPADGPEGTAPELLEPVLHGVLTALKAFESARPG
jgi:hypothetical protein